MKTVRIKLNSIENGLRMKIAAVNALINEGLTFHEASERYGMSEEALLHWLRFIESVGGQFDKSLLFLEMRRRHEKIREGLRRKKTLRVVFQVADVSLWKMDQVFRRMILDPLFEPVILVCPVTSFGDDRMWKGMEESLTYFKTKNYTTISSFLQSEQRWLKLDEIGPDIVFFTNPHNLTHHQYYEEAYTNYLSCYIPYSHDVSKYNSYGPQYNQRFHNSMWVIYVPHKEDQEIFRVYSQTLSRNVVVTGYPSCENFVLKFKGSDPWKRVRRNMKRIIWAPHHTIDSKELPYSNFLALHGWFKNLALNNKDTLQIAFKPHPLLRERLYLNEDWGREKTDAYFAFWAEGENTQLETGDYVDLFISSDAMIHDSGSFLAEYLYLQKPVFFICDEHVKHYLNPFGIKALASCTTGKTPQEIEAFVSLVKSGSAPVDDSFFRSELEPYFSNILPSEKIVLDLKGRLVNL